MMLYPCSPTGMQAWNLYKKGQYELARYLAQWAVSNGMSARNGPGPDGAATLVMVNCLDGDTESARLVYQRVMGRWEELCQVEATRRFRTLLRQEGFDIPGLDERAAIQTSVAEGTGGVSDDQYVLRPEGSGWIAEFEGRRTIISDLKGNIMIAHLLGNRERSFWPRQLLEVAAGGNPLPTTTSGDDVADEDALKAYEERRKELELKLDEGVYDGDIDAKEQAKFELADIRKTIDSAKGLGGRRRKLGDKNESARVAVTQAIHRAIEHIEKVHKPFAEHLRKYLKTGASVCYMPPRSITWEI